MKVAGVDGYKRGWVAVVLEEGVFNDAWTAPSFEAIRTLCADATAIAVDIPIGLPPAPPRPADVAAKLFLRPRGSAVFATYPEWLYGVAAGRAHRERYAEARRLCRERGWAVVSSQSFALGSRILELVPWSNDPVVLEVHPEVSFRELAGRDLGDKKTWHGLMGRCRALAEEGIEIPEDLPSASDVPADDLLDAAIAAWSADRYAKGIAQPLPADRPRGRPGAIWR